MYVNLSASRARGPRAAAPRGGQGRHSACCGATGARPAAVHAIPGIYCTYLHLAGALSEALLYHVHDYTSQALGSQRQRSEVVSLSQSLD
jgi:hypothetical protein